MKPWLVEISRSCKRNEALCTGSVLNERLTRRANVNPDAAGLAADGGGWAVEGSFHLRWEGVSEVQQVS